MKTFNPIFLPHTPKNEFNYIGAAERYFEKINGGFAPETKDAYIDYYNNNIFPCISYGKRIDDYTVEYVEDLILKIKEENKVVQEQAKSMRKSISGKNTPEKDEKAEALIMEYVKENTVRIVDPLNIKESAREAEEKQKQLLKELDRKIKFSNATTYIEV